MSSVISNWPPCLAANMPTSDNLGCRLVHAKVQKLWLPPQAIDGLTATWTCMNTSALPDRTGITDSFLAEMGRFWGCRDGSASCSGRKSGHNRKCASGAPASPQGGLHPSPKKTGGHWEALVNEPMTEAELAKVRQSAQRGAPFGSMVGTRETAIPGGP